MKRGTGQLAVEERQTIFGLHDFEKDLQVVGRDLMPKAAAAAVEHHHDLLGHGNTKLLGERGIVDVLRMHDLDF